uniref:Uncharacterized protein n=1 Tax=Timema monikensis TaxID=170555 RepID=A0A7R9HRY5_9NEOP|nr:unnamed protein product [Timema monikensis]
MTNQRAGREMVYVPKRWQRCINVTSQSSFNFCHHCIPWQRDAINMVALKGRMLGSPPPVCPIRLCGITGYDGRVNDVVYCHPSLRADHQTVVVFFGGDVQDFPENMESHRDNKNYLKWNLENTAVLLHSYFLDSHVVVVRPSRMEFKTFSCYDNFVPCNNCGAPDHTPTHSALQHLERMLQGISQRLRTMPVTELTQTPVSQGEESREEGEILPQDPEDSVELWWREGLNLDKANLVLLGFSKGCVVLNQFIYEFHYLKTLTPDDETMMRLVSRIQDMYWLDGGHAGGKNTWITSRSLLETLTRLGIGIHIHVTPYQVQDERRPWIRKEEKAFGDLLRRLGAPVNRTLHFENQVASLYTHFEVLTVFKQ